MDKLCSCGLDGDLQIKLVRCWPCLSKCLLWPFPTSPSGRQFGIHYLSSDCDVLCRPSDASICQVPPGLAWQSILCQACCQALDSPPSQLWSTACHLVSRALSMTFGSLETNGRTQIGSVGSWPLPLPNEEVRLMPDTAKEAKGDIYWESSLLLESFCFSKEI